MNAHSLEALEMVANGFEKLKVSDSSIAYEVIVGMLEGLHEFVRSSFEQFRVLTTFKLTSIRFA